MHQTTSVRRPRRTQDEIAHLVAEYATSGLSRAAFCRTHQLSWATLARYLQRAAPAAADRVPSASFVAIELAGAPPAGESGLTIVLAGGRRLAVQRGFCVDTLHQLL